MTDAIIVIIMIKSYALAVIIPLVVLSISALCVKQKKALSLADVDLVNPIYPRGGHIVPPLSRICV